MNHRFSRREFYDLVWSKPMAHITKELGVSDVALHKVCGNHGNPNPPSGWQAKKAAGKRADQIALPKTKQGQSITIGTGRQMDCGSHRVRTENRQRDGWPNAALGC